MRKVGRNDPCPCGSGKKYKLCCLPSDASSGIIRIASNQEEQTAAKSVPAPRPAGAVDSLIGNAPWANPAYRTVAEELAQQMKGSYTPKQIEQALRLWIGYSIRDTPVIRKSAVFAAAIEYCFATQTGAADVTKAGIAEKYGVAATTLSQRAQQLIDFAVETGALAPEEEEDVPPGQDPLSVERAVRDLTKQLESHQFDTIQEAQAYFQELLRGQAARFQEDEEE